VILHRTTDKLKQYSPMWLASRVRGGDDTTVVIEYKRWRPSESEPSWNGPRVRRRTITTDADVPFMPNQRGHAGLWTAHLVSTNDDVARWGEVHWKSLDD
jgi:hypothetical protein